MLEFNIVQETNKERAKHWHKDGEVVWSGLEWAGAMCGEAGEAANVCKKLKRIEGGLIGNSASEHRIEDKAKLIECLGKGIGDTLLYLFLLASHYNINVEEVTRDVFNKKSIELGLPELLSYSGI